MPLDWLACYNNNVSNFITIVAATSNNMGFTGTINGTNFNLWDIYTPRGGGNKDNSFLVKTLDIGPVTSANAIKELNSETYANIIDIIDKNLR